MSLTTLERFSRLLKQLNCTLENPKNSWADLIKAYNEPHRHYHTEQHLNECLQLFDRYFPLADKPLEVEFSLWFHDAIYDTQANDNELKSAQWAKNILQQGNVDNEISGRVSNLILASAHQHSPQTQDEKLLVDIDLSIFSTTPERFAQYQQQIHQEYNWVSENIYQQKRQQILKSFYERTALYLCPEIRTHLESQARFNLQQALVNKA